MKNKNKEAQERAETGTPTEFENKTGDELKRLLKIYVVKNDKKNLEYIVALLKSTIELRRNMLKDESLDLMESFPFFFVSPALVRQRYSTIF